MIIVECNNDEFVLLALRVGKKKIRHESGKGDVLRKAGKNSPVLAFIDDQEIPGLRAKLRDISVHNIEIYHYDFGVVWIGLVGVADCDPGRTDQESRKLSLPIDFDGCRTNY